MSVPRHHPLARLRGWLGHGLLCLCLLLPSAAFAHEVAVVVAQPGGPYQAFADALRRASAGTGHRIVFAGSAAQGMDEAALARADLVVASGEAAAAAVLGRHPGPVLATMLSRAGFERLRRRHPAAALSALTLDQPLDRQLRLLRALMPESRRVGALVGEAGGDQEALAAAAARAGLDLAMAVVAGESALMRGLETVLRDSDAFLAVPDPLLSSPSAARAILLTSYRFRTPVIAFSQAYVEAGALAAVYSTPEQVATEVAAWLASAKKDKPRLPAPRGPAAFEIAINHQVARALGVRVDDEAALRRLTEGGAPR